MRIALLLRGMAYCHEYIHPSGKRLNVDYKKSIENYKEYLFENNNVDVFYHTYYSNGLDIDDINREYKPKAYAISKDNELSKIPVVQKYQSCINSLISVLNIFNDYYMRKQPHYDYVIVTRFDLLFKIHLHDLPLEKNKFMISCMTESKLLMDDNFFISDFPFFKKYLKVLCNRDNSKMLHFDYGPIRDILGKDKVKILIDGNYRITYGTPLYSHVRHVIDNIFIPNKSLIFYNYKTKKYLTCEQYNIKASTYPTCFSLINNNTFYNITIYQDKIDKTILAYDTFNCSHIIVTPNIKNLTSNKNANTHFISLNVKIYKHECKDYCYKIETIDTKKFLCSFGNKITLVDNFTDACLWMIY